MKSVYTTFATFAASASAFTYPQEHGTGVGASPKHTNIREANQHPNVTTAVTFAFGSQNDWTLRVNLTELSVPDASPGPLSDPRYFNTVYDLEWPGDKSLNKSISAAIQTKQPQLCGNIIFSQFPENVTNAYKESDKGSCESALGTACVDALKRKYSSINADGCAGGAFPNNIPECTGSFSSEYEAFGFELNSPGLNTTGMTHKQDVDYDSFPLKNGGGFAFSSSEAYNGTDRSLYDAELGRLHMVVLSSDGNIYPLCARMAQPQNATSTSPSASPSSSGSATATPSKGAAAGLNNVGPYLMGAVTGASILSYYL